MTKITADEISKAKDWLFLQWQTVTPGPIQTIMSALDLAAAQLIVSKPVVTKTGEELQAFADNIEQAKKALNEQTPFRDGARPASPAFVQRKLGIAYNAAFEIFEALEAQGFITSLDNAGRRWVIRQDVEVKS